MRKQERIAAVTKFLDKYKGDISAFAKILAQEYPEHTYSSWRSMIHRIKASQPDFLPDFEERYNSAIPKIWDGSQMDLARMLYRRDSSISVEAWRNRIRSAYDNGAITKTEKPDFVVEHLRKAAGSGEDLWMAIEEKAKVAIAKI